MPAIRAIILDFDDTLFMTEQVSFEMENEATRRLGFCPHDSHRPPGQLG